MTNAIPKKHIKICNQSVNIGVSFSQLLPLRASHIFPSPTSSDAQPRPSASARPMYPQNHKAWSLDCYPFVKVRLIEFSKFAS